LTFYKIYGNIEQIVLEAVMTKNRSDRDAWHVLNKVMPILALVAVIGVGGLVFVKVGLPMIENIVAGYLPQK